MRYSLRRPGQCLNRARFALTLILSVRSTPLPSTTLCSSVTFSHLIPGSSTRLSGQVSQALAARATQRPLQSYIMIVRTEYVASPIFIPSQVLIYPNKLKGVGATVNAPSTRYAAKNNNWRLVRYFKLLLHPPSMSKQQSFHFEGAATTKVYVDLN